MKMKFCKIHMKTAELYSQMSYAIRRKVGAVLVSSDNTRILLCGYNGSCSGFPNVCEKEIIKDGVVTLETLPEVVHAEENIISFAAKHGMSTNNTNLYTTLSPCIQCSKMIINSGITRVFYKEKYRDVSGLDLLEKAGIEVIQLTDID